MYIPLDPGLAGMGSTRQCYRRVLRVLQLLLPRAAQEWSNLGTPFWCMHDSMHQNGVPKLDTSESGVGSTCNAPGGVRVYITPVLPRAAQEWSNLGTPFWCMHDSMHDSITHFGAPKLDTSESGVGSTCNAPGGVRVYITPVLPRAAQEWSNLGTPFWCI